MRVGIESINFYGGPAVIPARTIFEGRGWTSAGSTT